MPEPDPNPQERDEETIALHQLYHEVASVIRLIEASKSPRIMLDGDIEIDWPEETMTEITTRIAARKASILTKAQAL